MSSEKEVFNFAELFPLKYQAHEMPPLESYPTRDGSRLGFRRYMSATPCALHLILLHGSAAHSAYLHAFAHYLSSAQIANVYTPDLRGHGPEPSRRGDIDFIEQLELDVVDLIDFIKQDKPEHAQFIIGGHSSGGGLALRVASGKHGHLIRQVILIAPYFGHNTAMVKKDAGGWAAVSSTKLGALSLLNGLGIRAFNGTKVLRFNLPSAYCNGCETLSYSYRLMKGLHPANYKESLMHTQAPVLVMVGTADESLTAAEFESSILLFKQDVKIAYFNQVTHLGIVLSESAMRETANWIAGYASEPSLAAQ